MAIQGKENGGRCAKVSSKFPYPDMARHGPRSGRVLESDFSRQPAITELVQPALAPSRRASVNYLPPYQTWKHSVLPATSSNTSRPVLVKNKPTRDKA